MRLQITAISKKLCAVGLIGTVSAVAHAAGFQLFEQSGSGLGNAYAGGAAGAEDASTVYFNPAGMSYLPGHQVAGALHTIIPSTEFTNAGSTTALGAPATGGDGGDAGVLAIVPNLYFTTDMLGHGIHVGAGLNTPFGLKTQYYPGWVGRYQGVKSELSMIDLKGAVSYEINDMFSVGAGIDFVRANAELSNAVDFGAICFAPPPNGAGGAGCAPFVLPGNRGTLPSDGNAIVDGDDWGVGYNLGVIVEPIDGTRIGAAFHSKVGLEIEGTADFTNPVFAGPFAGFNALTARFTDTGASAKLTLPEVASFSVFSQLNPHWAVMADVTWTNWSRFEELVIDFDNTLPNTRVPQNWDDSFRYAGGVTYTHNDSWKFRLGAAYDETPVDDAFRTPRIPDEDRVWVSFGVSHQISPQGSIDAGYTYIFVDDASLNKVGESDGGRLRGNYDADVNILSLQYTHRF